MIVTIARLTFTLERMTNQFFWYLYLHTVVSTKVRYPISVNKQIKLANRGKVEQLARTRL